MSGLGSLFIDLLLRSGKFETDLGRNARLAEKRAKEIERSFSRLGSRITGALGGIAAGFSLSAIITETANAERALAALDNAVRNNAGSAGLTTGDLVDMSSELQRLTTYGDDAIQEMQALLLTFRQIGGSEFKRAQVAVLDVATALGQDLNSAAKLVGRALADPVKGMTQLSRAGVVLSESQKEVIKKLAESGKTAEAQAALLAQLESRFSGAARAARDTFGGAIEGLKNAFGDLLESKSGLRATTSAINELTDAISSPEVTSAADSLTSAAVSSIGAVGKVAAAALKPVADFINLFGDLGALLDNKIFSRPLSEAEFSRIFGVDPRGTGPTRRGRALQVASVETPEVPSEEFENLSAQLQQQIELYGKVGKAAEISNQIQSGSLDELSKSEQAQLLAMARRYDAIVSSSDAEKKASEEQRRAVEEIQKMTQSLEEQIATFGMSETQVLQYRIAHGDLAAAFAQGGEDAEKMKEKLIGLTREFEMIKDAASEAAEAIADFSKENADSADAGVEAIMDDFENRFLETSDKLNVFADQAARNTQDIIADGLISGFDKGADGILKSFGDMIIKLTAQAVAADIASRLFGAAGGGTGSGWIGAIAGAFGYGGGRAIGGPVLAGTTYRINEREPEFFRPRVGGDIIPLSKMNVGGGMALTQNFSVRTESGDRVTRRTEQQLAAAASRGLAMASRRNN